MPRPTYVAISASSLQHNLQQARRAAHGARVWAVVKANAYGHGLEVAMSAFAGADGLALVEFDGARRLRELGWRKPILMLEGAFDPSDLSLAQSLELSLVVHSAEQVAMIGGAAAGRPVTVFVKFNSGMNRLGLDAAGLRAAHAALSASPAVGEVNLMTHFANADVPGGTTQAFADFNAAARGLAGQRSTSNSAAVIDLAATHGDWVRPGVMLYGASPFGDRNAASLGLRGAMRLGSRLIAVQTLKAGDAVGYGSIFRATGPMRIGVVACGYADGYPRHAPSGTPVAVAGQRTATVGRVAMDMLMVDLTAVPNAAVGDEVELWGGLVAIDEVAHSAGTIGYELMCAVAPRVARRLEP